MDTNKVLSDIIDCKIDVSPRKIYLQLERNVRQHPKYLQTRLSLAAQGYDVHDKIIYGINGQQNGYVQFVCINKDEEIEDYVRLPFTYVGGGLLGRIRIEFKDYYRMSVVIPSLKDKKEDDDGGISLG